MKVWCGSLQIVMIAFAVVSDAFNVRLVKKMAASSILGLSLCSFEAFEGPWPAQAIEVKNLNDEVAKLKQVQDALDSRDIPFEDLPSGVSYREFRDGKGEKRVAPGSEVIVEMTLRCKKLATQKEPGGVTYYSTAKDTSSGVMSWTIGDGSMIPGIEEAMLAQGGMRRNAIRRIEVPSTQIFKARREGQLPLQKDADELRLTKNLWKTEATMIGEVKVNKIIAPTGAGSL